MPANGFIYVIVYRNKDGAEFKFEVFITFDGKIAVRNVTAKTEPAFVPSEPKKLGKTEY